MLTSVWSVAMAAALGANPAFSGVPSNGYAQSAVPAQPVSLQSGIVPTSGMSPYGGYLSGGQPMTPEAEVYGGGGGGYGGEYYGGPMGGGMPGSLPSGAYPGNEPLYPYDTQLPWMHGYFQEMPSYGGFSYYRPYNYKHVMPQSQVSAAWGNSSNMPYSHQYFDRVGGHPTVWNGSRKTNIARHATDLQSQIAAVDRPAIVPSRRKAIAPNIVYTPAGQNVPVGYRAPAPRGTSAH